MRGVEELCVTNTTLDTHQLLNSIVSSTWNIRKLSVKSNSNLSDEMIYKCCLFISLTKLKLLSSIANLKDSQ